MLEQSGSGQVPVDFAGVKEIFPLPETNDSLHVTMKDGSCREGVVSAVTDTMFVLIGEGVAMIPFADMQEIRYCGKVVRVREPGSRGKTDTWKKPGCRRWFLVQSAGTFRSSADRRWRSGLLRAWNYGL